MQLPGRGPTTMSPNHRACRRNAKRGGAPSGPSPLNCPMAALAGCSNSLVGRNIPTFGSAPTRHPRTDCARVPNTEHLP
jgi:hypothetical protein